MGGDGNRPRRAEKENWGKLILILLTPKSGGVNQPRTKGKRTSTLAIFILGLRKKGPWRKRVLKGGSSEKIFVRKPAAGIWLRLKPEKRITWE